MRLVRDHLRTFEFGLHEISSLQSVERLCPLYVVTSSITQREGAIEHTLQLWRCPPSGHTVEGSQGKLQAELLLVAFGASRQELKQLQATREQTDGVFVRIDALRHRCRTLVIRERLLDHTRALVLRRNLATDRIKVVRMQGF